MMRENHDLGKAFFFQQGKVSSVNIRMKRIKR
jgi:hypothetical protein